MSTGASARAQVSDLRERRARRCCNPSPRAPPSAACRAIRSASPSWPRRPNAKRPRRLLTCSAPFIAGFLSSAAAGARCRDAVCAAANGARSRAPTCEVASCPSTDRQHASFAKDYTSLRRLPTGDAGGASDHRQAGRSEAPRSFRDCQFARSEKEPATRRAGGGPTRATRWSRPIRADRASKGPRMQLGMIGLGRIGPDGCQQGAALAQAWSQVRGA